MKIVLIADTWAPDTNVLALMLKQLYTQLQTLEHEVYLVQPGMFETYPCPGFPDIRLAIHPEYMSFVLRNLTFDTVHIATEGPIGWAARDYCLNNSIAFTTSSYIDYPEIVKERFKIPLWLTYKMFRKFHYPSSKILVCSEQRKAHLLSQGFDRIEVIDLMDKNNISKFIRMQVYKDDIPTYA